MTQIKREIEKAQKLAKERKENDEKEVADKKQADKEREERRKLGLSKAKYDEHKSKNTLAPLLASAGSAVTTVIAASQGTDATSSSVSVASSPASAFSPPVPPQPTPAAPASEAPPSDSGVTRVGNTEDVIPQGLVAARRQTLFPDIAPREATAHLSKAPTVKLHGASKVAASLDEPAPERTFPDPATRSSLQSPAVSPVLPLSAQLPASAAAREQEKSLLEQLQESVRKVEELMNKRISAEEKVAKELVRDIERLLERFASEKGSAATMGEIHKLKDILGRGGVPAGVQAELNAAIRQLEIAETEYETREQDLHPPRSSSRQIIARPFPLVVDEEERHRRQYQQAQHGSDYRDPRSLTPGHSYHVSDMPPVPDCSPAPAFGSVQAFYPDRTHIGHPEEDRENIWIKLYREIKKSPEAQLDNGTVQVMKSQNISVDVMFPARNISEIAQVAAETTRKKHMDEGNFRIVEDNQGKISYEVIKPPKNGPVFIPVLDDNNNHAVDAHGKPRFDILHYENYKLVPEKSFIAPDITNSRSGVSAADQTLCKASQSIKFIDREYRGAAQLQAHKEGLEVIVAEIKARKDRSLEGPARSPHRTQRIDYYNRR